MTGVEVYWILRDGQDAGSPYISINNPAPCGRGIRDPEGSIADLGVTACTHILVA